MALLTFALFRSATDKLTLSCRDTIQTALLDYNCDGLILSDDCTTRMAALHNFPGVVTMFCCDSSLITIFDEGSIQSTLLTGEAIRWALNSRAAMEFVVLDDGHMQ